MDETMFPGEDLPLPMSLQLLPERLKSSIPADILQAMPMLTASRQRSQIRDVLDKSIQNLQRFTCDLKTYRNSIASVNLLPDELLAKIFAEYRYEEAGGPWQTKWCKIFFVCKRWKNCALSTSQLWSCIGNSQHSSKNALSRMHRWHSLSKGQPLQLQFHFSESEYFPDSDHFHVFLRKTPVHRIISLELFGRLAELRSFLSYANPFIFTTNVALTVDTFSGETEPYHFPEHLFNSDKIQTLSLKNVAFSSVETLRRMSNLTSLTFKREDDNIPHLPLSDILAVVDNCPRLARLELLNAVELSDTEGTHPVDLPILEYITLWITAPVLNALLKWMQIPASTFMNLEIVGNGDKVDELLQKLGTHFRRADSPTFRSMFLSRGGMNRLCALGLSEARVAPSKVGLLARGEGLPFRIGLPMTTPSPRQQISVLRRLFHELPLQSIEHVDATGNMSIHYDGLSQQAWRTFFTFLPGPVSVSIGMNDCLPMLLRGYLDTFTRSARAAAGGRAWSRLCRRSHLPLRELKLYGERHAREREELIVPAIISFLHQYKELKSEYKGVGELFQQINLPDPHGTCPRDISPLVSSLILHGSNDALEIVKRKRILFLWKIRQEYPDLLRTQDKELLMKHGHNVDEDGRWIAPAETMTQPTDNIDDEAEEMHRKAWEECEERMHMLREEIAEVFH